MNKSKSPITSKAGILAQLEFIKKINLDEHLESISVEKNLERVYSFHDVLKMITIGITAGAKSLLSVVAAWNDKVLAEVANIQRIPDDSTMGRILKRSNLGIINDLERIPSILRDKALLSYLTPKTAQINCRREIIIDIDATHHASYGQQEGSVKGYNITKKGGNCYQSLLAFDSFSKTLMLGWLRAGNTNGINGFCDFIDQLKAIYPQEKSFVRCDSGFFSGDTLDKLESHNMSYLIKARLKNIDRITRHDDWASVPGKPGKKGWQQLTFEYSCAGWKKSRKFYAVRIKVDQIEEKNGLFEPEDMIIEKYLYFCYVCTKGLSPWTTHCLYKPRAVCENYIEELKNQMGLGKMKSRDFNATSVMFHCCILAYNLLRWMTICSGKSRLFKWEMSHIRCFLICVAGKLIRTGRQIFVEIDDQHLYQEELDAWLSFCT